MQSVLEMTEERIIAASAFGAPAHREARAMVSTSVFTTVQLNAYGKGGVCPLADSDATHVSPATKAWAVRPLIPDGGGGG